MLKKHFPNNPSSSKELARFGFNSSTGLLLLGTIALWNHHSRAPLLLTAGILLALMGLLSPRALKPLQLVWTTLLIILGFLLLNTALAITYYLVITPIGLIMRFLRRVSFEKNIDKKTHTYWKDRITDQITTEESLKRQF